MTNVYDALYQEMKDRFTVVKGESEYSLGGYMRMKAQEKREKAEIPAATVSSSAKTRNLHKVVSFVKDKLAVKEHPSAEKTIKNFPVRTSISALCAALLLCTLLFSYAFLNARTTQLPEDGIVLAASETAEEDTAENSSYLCGTQE